MNNKLFVKSLKKNLTKSLKMKSHKKKMQLRNERT